MTHALSLHNNMNNTNLYGLVMLNDAGPDGAPTIIETG